MPGINPGMTGGGSCVRPARAASETALPYPGRKAVRPPGSTTVSTGAR